MNCVTQIILIEIEFCFQIMVWKLGVPGITTAMFVAPYLTLLKTPQDICY